ncbi:hypothetical protein [Cryobacterium tepidiphilum]|jgi:hypothetical protein|uniref:DNA helicase n=1 Tax=Cryobacterium tepidiphilum TaxID=2486026 RepID=A0A3M8LQG4_9MICO|nr:hypothetical protein [Cryobacterium tepidiphilum]RNE66964.1 hypothetical protein EEJ31_01785 [Cryobacterium tepidiphilum]
MSLSRKRRKELDRLRKHADELWSQQQDVLDRAGAVAREAARQASVLTREEVVPRVVSSYDQYVKPHVATTQGIAGGIGHRVAATTLPAVGTAIGAVMSVGDVAKDARVRAALSRMHLQKPVVVEKKGPGVGTFIALGAAVVAAAGVGYAIWQTFKADDELWVAEEDEVVVTTPSTTGGTATTVTPVEES